VGQSRVRITTAKKIHNALRQPVFEMTIQGFPSSLLAV
jgi:hypothetical protein